MKNQKSIKLALTGLGALLFNGLFWEEGFGLNGLIFAIFILGGLFFIHRKEKVSRYALITGAATLFSAIMVVVNFSAPAKLALLCSSLLTVGFLNHHSFRSVIYAISGAFAGLTKVPKEILTSIQFSKDSKKDWHRGFRYTKLFVIPFIAATAFLLIFRGANPIFKSATDQFMDWVYAGFETLFTWFSPGHLSFLIFGFILTAWAFFARKNQALMEAEANIPEEVQRKKRKKGIKAFFNPISLKNENSTGAILMGMVSVMATVVNAIDIVYIWVGFEYVPNMNLSQLVHEGTYLLILSILLSMAIMLYYFRGNQNFYQRNSRLRWLANIWIVQNVIMVLSVGIRNYHYIYYNGLAYKRIGVIFFLGLTLFGLFTLFMKIRHKKSAFYLFRTNSWATYVMILMLSAVNWDGMIAHYNITHWNKAYSDVSFLLSLSDKALPILDQHRSAFEGHVIAGSIPAEEILDERIQRFVDKSVDYSWLSWTWPEGKALAYFEEKGVEASNR